MNAKCLLYSSDTEGDSNSFLERVYDAVVVSETKLVCLIDMLHDFGSNKYAVTTGMLPDVGRFKFSFHAKLDYVFNSTVN